MKTAGWRVAGWQERSYVLGAATAVSAAYVALAGWRGALGAARNDDWAYLRVVERFVASGDLRFDGWTQMSFVGQALLAWPAAVVFGSEVVVYQLLVALLGTFGLAALWCTVRLWLAPSAATLVLGIVVVGPLYGSLATSFMTDVPAFAATSVCLMAGAHVTRRFSATAFGVLCVAGLLSVSIREYGLAPLGVGLGAAVWSAGRSARTLVLAGSVLTATACVALLAWRRTLVGGGPPVDVTVGVDELIAGFDKAARASLTLGLLIAPIVLAFGRPMRGSSPVQIAVAVSAWALILWRSEAEFVGNYVSPLGSYVPLVRGALPRVLPDWLYGAARIVAALALLEMLLAGIRALGRLGPAVPALSARLVVAATCAITLGLHAALALLTDAPLFDRYLLAPAAWLASLAVPERPSWPDVGRLRQSLGVASAVLLALVSARLVGAAGSLDGGAWRSAEELSTTVNRQSIDAGFAWFNYHQSGPVHTGWVDGRNWWTSFYPEQPVCVSVVARSGNGPGPAFGLFGPSYEFAAQWSDDVACQGLVP